MKELYGKEREWSIEQIKTCRKKQHVKIGDRKEMPDLICDKTAVGGNYNSTHDTREHPKINILQVAKTAYGCQGTRYESFTRDRDRAVNTRIGRFARIAQFV